MDRHTGEEHQTYRIAVQGRLDPSWSTWLGEMSVSMEWAGDAPPVTVLTGPLMDQAALRGLLNRLWDLNLTLISVNPVWKGPASEEANR